MGFGLLLFRLRVLADHPMTVVAPFTAFGLFATGHTLAGFGPADAPWLHFCYPLLCFAVVPVIGLAERALFGLLLPLALFGGFHVGLERGQRLPLQQEIFAFALVFMAGAVAIGEAMRRMALAEFVARRRAAHDRETLQDLTNNLDARVRAQTEELRMLARQTECAREEERTRIARELHDELGQELTALRYATAHLRRRYQKDQHSIMGNLDELEGLIQRTSTTTRNLVSELRPAVLDQQGLAGAAEWLVDRVSERASLEKELTLDGDLKQIVGDRAVALFRILQECLTNVAKHADASRIEVELALVDRTVSLRVRDDGVGFPPASYPTSAKGRPKARGAGILGMRERVLEFGGEIEWRQPTSRGVEVVVTMDLDAAPKEVRP